MSELVVDVSGWQSSPEDNSTQVDWDELLSLGITKVIIKIGENFKFSLGFISHVNTAISKGFTYGIYYYSKATSTDSAIKEAEWVDTQIKTYLNGVNPELGIWFDAEDNSMIGSDVTAICSAFISKLNSLDYTYVGIYSGWKWLSDESAEQQIHMDQLADYVPYWVAQYNSVNNLKLEQPKKNIVLWQFTDRYSDDLPYDMSAVVE